MTKHMKLVEERRLNDRFTLQLHRLADAGGKHAVYRWQRRLDGNIVQESSQLIRSEAVARRAFEREARRFAYATAMQALNR